MTTIVARAGKDPDQLLAALGHANWADAPREQVRRLTERAVQDIEARQVRAAMRRLAMVHLDAAARALDNAGDEAATGEAAELDVIRARIGRELEALG